MSRDLRVGAFSLMLGEAMLAILAASTAVSWLAVAPVHASSSVHEDERTLRLEHPQLEDMRIDTGEAEKQLQDIEEEVNSGILPKIEFDFDSDVIKPASYPTLDSIAEILMKNPTHKVLITAHTCRIGSYQYNMDLSLRRARSVKKYLTSKGVIPTYIRFRGKGYTEPIADNRTPEGRARNRRVEFHILTREWSAVY